MALESRGGRWARSGWRTCTALTDCLLVLAAVHVTGVAAASWRHRENLVAAMVSGRKRPPAPGDVA